MNSIRDAEYAIKWTFAAKGPLAQFRYDSAGVIENDRWWFIPCGRIGSHGCIVNKADLYVNWLGSATNREDALWGHDHGLFHDLVDFAFAPDTPPDVAVRLVAQFRHMKPKTRGQEPREPGSLPS